MLCKKKQKEGADNASKIGKIRTKMKWKNLYGSSEPTFNFFILVKKLYIQKRDFSGHVKEPFSDDRLYKISPLIAKLRESFEMPIVPT